MIMFHLLFYFGDIILIYISIKYFSLIIRSPNFFKIESILDNMFEGLKKIQIRRCNQYH